MRASKAPRVIGTAGDQVLSSTGPGDVGPRVGPGRLELAVLTVGAASLGAEIAGARLLAPWFGASTIVWANTIAVVLVALSPGYAMGARLAARNPRPEGLAGIILPAAVLLAAVPFASEPFLPLAVR